MLHWLFANTLINSHTPHHQLLQVIHVVLLQRAACGLCGLVLAMLLETVLLMIETNRFEAPRRPTKGSNGVRMQPNKKQQ